MRAVYTIAVSIQIAIGICGPGETYACANSTRPKMLRALDMRAMMTNKRESEVVLWNDTLMPAKPPTLFFLRTGSKSLAFGAR